MTEYVKMKSSPMHDAMIAAWAIALALGYDDPINIDLRPAIEPEEMWSASMWREADTGDAVQGKGPTPESALGAMVAQMQKDLVVKRKTIEQAMEKAMSHFDKACAWDELNLRVTFPTKDAAEEEDE